MWLENKEIQEKNSKITWLTPDEALKIMPDKSQDYVTFTSDMYKSWEKIAQLDKENTQKFEDILKNYLKIETV